MSERMSDRMSQDMSDRMPDRMPEFMSDRMPDRLSEYMSDSLSYRIYVQIYVTVGITRSKVIWFELFSRYAML